MPAATATAKPWLAVYPPQTPELVAEAPYRLIGDIARERAVATPTKTAFTCVMANGMKGSLTFAEVDRLSDAFAAYLREDLRSAAGDRVAIQIPNGLAYPGRGASAFSRPAASSSMSIRSIPAARWPKVFADAEISALVVIDMFAEQAGHGADGDAQVPHVDADRGGRTLSGRCGAR